MTHLSKLMTGTALALSLSALAVSADTIRFWTTEEQPERLAKQEEMAAQFKDMTGIEVEVIPVTESDLGTRATAAFAAGDLPDVIYHTLQYALPWAEAGILDTDAATEVIEELGADTFAPGAIAMAAYDEGTASVPVDGWTQMIVYRKDLFDAAGLEAPTSYANVQTALDSLHNPPEMYGFVAATKVDENFMSQVLEHVFLANGVSPVGPDGFQPLDEGKTIEVLEFYKAIAEASPPGDLYWDQSRTLYFSGNAAMIIWSPFILDELAGLRDSAPPTINDDPTSTDLASRTGIVTNFAGPSNPDGAAWGDVRYFGITTDADTDAAMEFAKFSVDEGYGQTLSIAPEGKFPVRAGTADQPDKFKALWATLPVGVDKIIFIKKIFFYNSSAA
ncbi:MAG: extracellular solute-binding protein [Alphaproteobacteria bacterium]|jgi:multiple sugar transport system substrate-binding protein|nr:extracellular solute-binding protein [Alphaproteobacteria bacterium]